MKPALELVATCDEGYLPPLRTMLYSAVANNLDASVRLWLIHSSISDAAGAELAAFARGVGAELELIRIDPDSFSRARSSKRYPKEMYYRLLAAHVVPHDIERVLYLDPDVLIINSLMPLYGIDLQGAAFAAASHTDAVHPATALNNFRLDTDHLYFNSGVMLIDCAFAREIVDPEALFAYAAEHEGELLFPDQDIFNVLYGRYCLPVPDFVWNFDARKLLDNTIRTMGRATLDWVIENTAILHFCGKDKPWSPGAKGPFTALYKHYDWRARR